MGPDVHLCKGADISDTDDVHGEVTIEVNDVHSSGSELEDEDVWGDDGTQELLQEVHLGGKQHADGRCILSLVRVQNTAEQCNGYHFLQLYIM